MEKRHLTYVSLMASIVITGCGSKDKSDNDNNGLSVPASIVSEAALTPVSLIAFDAANMKSEIESAGETFQAGSSNISSEPSCQDKLVNESLIEAVGSTLRLTATVDTSSCIIEGLKEIEGFEDADFSNLTATSSRKILLYYHCEGVDLSSFNGKKYSELGDLKECAKASKISSKFEFELLQKTTGLVKLSDGTVNYTYDTDYHILMAHRGTGEALCDIQLVDALFKYSDSCRNVTLSTFSNKAGTAGSETANPNSGKTDYRKIQYNGLTRLPESNDPWYSSGTMNVTWNDWEGTVKFSSPTAEPIFEMKKGIETVTGTIKKVAQ